LARLGPIRDLPRKKVSFWEKTLIHPDSRFKIFWDLIIIVLAVYNSIFIPYEFAYSVDEYVFIDVIDRIIDVAFAIDILVNFRTIYRDSRTDKEIKNGK
jgi:hypothetical protein